MTTAPVYDHDFFSDAFLADPYGHYRAMRDLAPAVYLPAKDLYALTRYADVHGALRNDALFLSRHGVAMNQTENDMFAGRSALNMDNPEHNERRRVIAKPLMPKALAPLREEVEAIASELVDELVGRRRFDGVADFAHILPLKIVSRIVGLPEDGREKMLYWASPIFNTMGNINHRYEAAVAARQEAVDYIGALRPEDMRPGSWGERTFALAADGEITDRQAREVIMSYVAPALDTTINATSGALLLLGQNPDQWDLVREQPSLIPVAIEEAMRLETPIRAFSRVTAEDADVDGTIVPKGARVLIVYASANRDERRWEEAERYNIQRRSPQEQLAFGTGTHMCAGMHLARLEMRALFSAFADRVARFEVGEPQREAHQMLRGMTSLPVTILEDRVPR